MMCNSDQFKDLWALMDQEVTSYMALVEDMKQEWEYLKKDDISSLLSLIQIKETHISTIKAIRESMDRILMEIIGKGIEQDCQRTLLDLAHHVSPSQAKKVMNHQKIIDRFRQQIIKFNEQNKHFIQETLNYLKDIFSLFTSSNQGEAVYVKDGSKISTPLQHSWMNRKV